MDHSNHNCNDKQCPHGRCLNHGPQWENIGEPRYVPDPDLFGLKKRYFFATCCGARMTRVRSVQNQRCKICKREQEFEKSYFIALCECCGTTQSMMDTSY